MNRIRLYILWQFLSDIAMVLIIVIGAIILVDVVEILRSIGSDVDLSLVAALRLSLLKLPMLLEQTLSFILLAASIRCFSRLNNRSELSIFRSVGISAWQFIFPAMLVSVTLGVVTMTVINPIGAATQVSFNEMRATLLNREISVASSNDGIWLRQEDGSSQTFINAKSVTDNGLTFHNVRMIVQERVYVDGQPTDTLQFDKRIDAQTAQTFNGFWQLSNVTEYTLDAPAQKFDTLAIPSTIDPTQFLQNFASPATIGFWQLPRFISQTQRAGLNTLSYESRWHGLLTLPAMFLAMTLVGALACLRLPRSGGTSLLIGAGATIAFGLYFFNQFASALGVSGAVPIWLAAWAPSVIVILLAGWFIAKNEDG